MTRATLAHYLTRLRNFLRGPDAHRPPAELAAPVPLVDRLRSPSPADLLAELRNTAWTCATLNAAACASVPPRLYVTTHSSQPAPKCATRALRPGQVDRLRSASFLPARTRGADRIEEVTEHPLLDLLRQVNAVHNAFDLWELTTLYQEILGSAYWLLDLDEALGIPTAIWPLPSHLVRPHREPDSPLLVDVYLYRSGKEELRLPPERVIHFRYPDPRDPYRAGLSPLRACYEQARLSSEMVTFKRTRLDNQALPDAIVSPDTVLGEEERNRLEAQWNAKLRRGGAGRVVVAESSLKVHVLAHSLGDLAALADLKATREEVANAFHVPIAYLSSETNLANLQAAEVQHARTALRPRVQRRDQKLNEQLVPRYDSSGRLFLASDDPVPADRDHVRRDRALYLKFGVVTINEVRSELGLPPVPWGDRRRRAQG